jgi:Lrp/AsnC family transcriptional regulator for asnA, asnC and gidA
MTSVNEKIDEKDLKIIKILMKNARTPYSAISKELGISDVAVIKRIKKLERMGVIKKYTLEVDATKIGYNAKSITGINVKPERLFDVLDALKDMDEVKYLAITSGDHHIIAVIWASDQDELKEVHNKINKIEGVESVRPAVVIKIIKDEAF